VGYRRRSRPTPGAEAFAYLFSGEARPPGIPTPLICCEKPSSQKKNSEIEFSNSIWLFDAYQLLTFFAKIIGCTCVHPCPFTRSAPGECAGDLIS